MRKILIATRGMAACPKCGNSKSEIGSTRFPNHVRYCQGRMAQQRIERTIVLPGSAEGISSKPHADPDSLQIMTLSPKSNADHIRIALREHIGGALRESECFVIYEDELRIYPSLSAAIQKEQSLKRTAESV